MLQLNLSIALEGLTQALALELDPSWKLKVCDFLYVMLRCW